MEIRVYLHRTQKKQFEVADCFSVFINFDKLPKDKQNDIDFINLAFKNDCQRIARTRECVLKYGTGYISFMRPQYEGPEEENGNGKVYFDNQEMLFKKVDKPKKIVKTIDMKVNHKKEVNNEEKSL